jgi:hypothetical protein
MGGAELTKRGSSASKLLWAYVMPVIQNVCVYLWPNGVLRTNTKSARDLVMACFDSQDYGNTSEAIFLNGTDKVMSSKESMNEAKQEQLWKDSVRLLGLREGDTVLKYLQ